MVDKIKKIILEIKFYFFSTFLKITVGGFVNQLIKNSGLLATEKNHFIEMVLLVTNSIMEHSGSVVECLTRD